MRTPSARERSFTLIELLTVIAIIGILASLLLSAIAGARRYAKFSQAKTDIKNIQTAITAYYNEYGKLPVQDNEQGGVQHGGAGPGNCDGWYGQGGLPSPRSSTSCAPPTTRSMCKINTIPGRSSSWSSPIARAPSLQMVPPAARRFSIRGADLTTSNWTTTVMVLSGTTKATIVGEQVVMPPWL